MYTLKRFSVVSMALLACLVCATVAQAKDAKYVFLFIGDGMGIPQRSATEAYTGKKMVMDTFPAQGVTTTSANNRFITGSAASATAIASGKKTNINYIGMDADLKPLKTVAEMAKDDGKKVGIISSVSIDHATPAAFYAHVPTRKMYHEIDMALANSGFDFFGGGGMVDPTGKKSKKPLGDAVAKAKENGYKYVNSKEEFNKLNKESGRVFVVNSWLQDSEALPYAMDMTDKDITLPELTGKAIEMLDNDKGFFMMVEGGKIDWACHANDAAAAIKDNIAFDESIAKAVEFSKKHPDETLIVVTGDHECGGMALGFAGTKYDTDFGVLGNQKGSFTKFDQDILDPYKKTHAKDGKLDDLKPVITEFFGLKFAGDPKTDRMVLKDFEVADIEKAFARSMAGESEKGSEESYLLYGSYDPLSVTLTHLLNRKAGLSWTSYSHTGVPILTSALGVGSESFNGSYDNTDIAKKIMTSMGHSAEVVYIN
ncbi:alkaline phosphatase [Desulfovibrio inopinatus]|uniref:alkaline phosphatase n=1 Tax=Desulfovibrio inopinatus TaxID=102109 RepID=UPI000416685C|nr:alkaline phosphatase [Desulfovibrio inopinatus]